MSEKNEVTFEQLNKTLNELYLIKDPYIIKLMCAFVQSHKLSADPIWSVIIAPSGGGKTEMINLLKYVKDVHPLSTLTPNTLISGARSSDGETSLLLQMKDDNGNHAGILTFEDFTTLMSERREDRNAIFGQLRGVYGGEYKKSFGTGSSVGWEGKITFVAGATPIFYSFRGSHTAALGERFILYEIQQPDRVEAARKTMENQAGGDIKTRRREAQEIFATYNNALTPTNDIIHLPKDYKEMILKITEMTTRARSEPIREKDREKKITEVLPPEMPTRFAGQIQIIAKTLININIHNTKDDSLTDLDKDMLNKIMMDSIPATKRGLMRALTKYNEAETTALATKLSLPTGSARTNLEDLNAQGLIKRIKGGRADRWLINDQYRDIISEIDKIEPLGEDLTEDKAELTDEELLNEQERRRAKLEEDQISPEDIERANRLLADDH